jgi:type VII secretion-associated serine protease mycosin
MRRARGAIAVALVAASVAGFSVVSADAASADQVRDAEYWLSDYGIRTAWATTQGAGVTIAVIDTGVDGTVPELAGAMVPGADFSGQGAANGQKPVGTGESDHGTMVASLAAGRGTGGNSGVLGVAPAASIMSLSIGLGDDTPNSDDQVAAAVRYAVDHGARVINMSLTRNTLEWPESWDSAFLYAMQHNAVIVAAAGNRGSGTSEVGAPATMPGVLTVAGVDQSGTASFDASAQGITIGVAAPSEQLVGVVPGGGHVLWSGTSGAAPIVSGIVALVMASHPQLDADNVIQRIVATAHDAGDPGPDPIYGFGRVDAAAAVTANVAAVTTNPMGDLAQWITIYRRAASTPAPVPTSVGEAAPAPTAPSVRNPLGVILPSVLLLRNVGVPLLVFLLFGGLIAWLVVGVVRRYRTYNKTR